MKTNIDGEDNEELIKGLVENATSPSDLIGLTERRRETAESVADPGRPSEEEEEEEEEEDDDPWPKRQREDHGPANPEFGVAEEGDACGPWQRHEASERASEEKWRAKVRAEAEEKRRLRGRQTLEPLGGDLVQPDEASQDRTQIIF